MGFRILLFLVLFAAGSLTNSRAASNRLPAEVSNALNHPTEVTVYSLHPESGKAHWFHRKYRGYRVFGQVLLTDPAERQQVAADVKRTAATYTFDTKCLFQPRHGVRIVSGSDAYDFVICFECDQLEIYSGERCIKKLSATGSPDVLNRILRTARIRIAD